MSTGRSTTAAQTVMVIVALMAPGIDGLRSVQLLLIWATAALTTISGLHYVYIGMNILQQVEENR